MGNVEATIRSEIIRLAKRETRRTTVPLSKNVRLLKSTVSRLRKTLSVLERSVTRWEGEHASKQEALGASPNEIKAARFSPRLIKVLRKRLGITQRELAVLSGVTVGAIHQWEQGIFVPRDEKKGVLVALRKLGRREVKRLLERKKTSDKASRQTTRRRRVSKRRARKRVSRK